MIMKIFWNLVGYTGLVAGIELSGILSTAESWDVVIYFLSLSAYRPARYLLAFSTEVIARQVLNPIFWAHTRVLLQKPSRSQIDIAPLRNGEPITHLLPMLSKMDLRIQERTLKLLTRMAKLSMRTCQTLFAAGWTKWFLSLGYLNFAKIAISGVAGALLRKFTIDDPLNPVILRLVTIIAYFR